MEAIYNQIDNSEREYLIKPSNLVDEIVLFHKKKSNFSAKAINNLGKVLITQAYIF